MHFARSSCLIAALLSLPAAPLSAQPDHEHAHVGGQNAALVSQLRHDGAALVHGALRACPKYFDDPGFAAD